MTPDYSSVDNGFQVTIPQMVATHDERLVKECEEVVVLDK